VKRNTVYYNYYKSILTRLNKREKDIKKVNSIVQVKERKEKVKKEFLDFTGHQYEENRLLSSKVVGEIHRGDYKIEKIIYEALPDYFVTSNLYLPNNNFKGNKPALLLPVGHSPLGKAYKEYQILAGNLAKKGYVAFVYDPIGQGERDLLPNREKERTRRDMWCVEQHMRAGNPNYLMGNHLSYFFINDSKRAIDYLLTRNEVDSAKIGAIGISGGGTNTAYLCAAEERIKLAIPTCCISNYKWILKKSMPMDVEQTFFGYIEKGFDINDLLWPFIGKPLLLNFGIKDVLFPIEGAREVYKELNRIYSILGQEEKIAKIESNSGHEFSKEMRECSYNWVNKWFGNEENNNREEEVEVLDEKSLFCTKSGNVANIGKTVFQINIGKYNELKKNYCNKVSKNKFIEETTELLGYKQYHLKRDIVLKEKDNLVTNLDYCVMNFFDDDNNSSTCKFWNKHNKKLVVFLDFKNYFNLDRINNKFKNLDILDITLPGQDITRLSLLSDNTGYDEDYQLYLLSILNGESIIATRIKHALYIIKYFLRKANTNYQVELIGTGQGGIIVLFTALLLTKDIFRVTATDYSSLYGNVFDDINYKIAYTSLFPNILKKYDLDSLVLYVAYFAKHVRLVNLVNGKMQIEDINTIYKKYNILQERGIQNVTLIQKLIDYDSLLP
jgi:cephalosporin-C deacetylase-like acetyl esterase